MDHNNRTTQFTDPRLNAQILQNLLRKGTQSSAPAATTSTTTTTVTSPVSSSTASTVTTATTTTAAAPLSPRTRPGEEDLPQSLLNDSELLPKYRRDLVGKLRALRAELTALQPQSGHCRLEVSRSEVFEESYRLVDICICINNKQLHGSNILCKKHVFISCYFITITSHKINCVLHKLNIKYIVSNSVRVHTNYFKIYYVSLEAIISIEI